MSRLNRLARIVRPLTHEGAPAAQGLTIEQRLRKQAGVLQTEVQSLSCERMDHVRGVAGERDARPDHASRREVTQGIAARRGDQ